MSSCLFNVMHSSLNTQLCFLCALLCFEKLILLPISSSRDERVDRDRQKPYRRALITIIIIGTCYFLST